MKKELHIYLLRGLTRESGHWGTFIDSLRKDSPSATIHFMDLPGAGIHFKSKASVNISKMVEFMREEHLEELTKSGRENIICATSLGGMLAVDWVLRHEEDFSGLIMVASSFKHICTLNERAQKRVWWDLINILITPNIRKRERLIIGVNSNKPELFEELTDAWTVIQRKRKMTKLNILKQTIAGMRFGLKDKKPELPMLIVGSKADRFVRPECIQKTHNYLGGTLVWHATSGHGIPVDEPGWLSQEISKWCENQFKTRHVPSL